MMRTALIGVAIVFAARSAWAQDPLTNAKNAAKKAVAATNAHIEAEQHPEAQQQKAPTPAAKQPAAKQPAAKQPAAKQPAAKQAGTKQSVAAAQPRGVQHPAVQLTVPMTDTAGPPPSILREVFDYSHDGRRDPFNSLLTTSELRPTLSDLRLVGILVDHTGGRSVATLRDLATNAQYRITAGATLGRMRVSAIKLMSVVFTIDEFGTTRQDSLILRDTTKVRRP